MGHPAKLLPAHGEDYSYHTGSTKKRFACADERKKVCPLTTPYVAAGLSLHAATKLTNARSSRPPAPAWLPQLMRVSQAKVLALQGHVWDLQRQLVQMELERTHNRCARHPSTLDHEHIPRWARCCAVQEFSAVH